MEQKFVGFVDKNKEYAVAAFDYTHPGGILAMGLCIAGMIGVGNFLVNLITKGE